MDDYTSRHVDSWKGLFRRLLDQRVIDAAERLNPLYKSDLVMVADELGLGLPYVMTQLARTGFESGCGVQGILDSLSDAYVENNTDWEVIPFIASASVVMKAGDNVALIWKDCKSGGDYVHLGNGEYFPGGICEYLDASPAGTAAREVEEETGLLIAPEDVELLGVNFYDESVDLPRLGISGAKRQVFMPTYAVVVDERELEAGGDAGSAYWKPVEYVVDRLPEDSIYIPSREIEAFLLMEGE